jgi:Asp-tRNA(Asn)/Glu-tRNA(Gln) amidotransferase A subunit family amidase
MTSDLRSGSQAPDARPQAEGFPASPLSRLPGIRDTVAAIAAGSVTSRSLLESAREAEARHRDLNAIAWVDWDAAARAADALDAAARAGHPMGALHGIPVTIKDLYNVDGMPTAAGTRAVLPDLGGESVAVTRLRAAGALTFAKTNMHEIALGATGKPAASTKARARTVSPISSICPGVGPTKTRPACSTARAKSAFSDRNP